MAGLRTLRGEDLKVWVPEGGAHLRIEVKDDRTILAARVRRIFPLSDPERYFSILDGSDKEVGILERLDELEPEARKLMREDLERRYFTPVIDRFDAVENQRGMWKFVGQTQRGPVEFYVRNWRDSAHEVSPNRWQIVSVDGQRYEVRDIEALDARSQRLLDQLL